MLAPRAPFLIAGIALMAFTGIAAGMLRPGPPPPPPIAPDRPDLPLTLAKADRLPLAAQLSIEDRWQQMVAEEASVTPPPAAVRSYMPHIAPAVPAPSGVIRSNNSRNTHRDVCRGKGRIWTHHHRSWRCRR